MENNKDNKENIVPGEVTPNLPLPETKTPVQPEIFDDLGFGGIDEETKGTGLIPFPVEEVYLKSKKGILANPFHLAYLVDVEGRQYIRKNPKLLPGVELGEKDLPTVQQVTPDSVGTTLAFKFVNDPVNPTNVAYLTLYEPLPETRTVIDSKTGKNGFTKGMEEINERLVHLFESTSGTMNTTHKVFGMNILREEYTIKTPGDYILALADKWNKIKPQEVNGKLKPLRLKITIYDNKAQIPRYGNIVELYDDKKPSSLAVGPKDSFVMKSKTSSSPVSGINTSGTDAPNSDVWNDLPM